MRLWFQRAKKEKNTVFAAAAQGDVSAFAAVRVSGKKALRAALSLGALALRRKLGGGRGTRREQKAVARQKQQAYKRARR